MRTLVYTCADKEYACWIPLYCLGMLMNNNDIDIEIGIEGTISEDIQQCLKMLRLWFPDSQILIKENFFERVGNLALINGKKTLFNTVRFITQPIIKADYVYIGDIDIICMEKNIFQQHIDHMNSLGLVYSNIVRKNNPTHFSGLHFSKYDAYYPLPDISKLNLLINDEIILKKIVELKGHKIDYNTTFRPLHGIHFSKNRPTVKGDDKIMGWGAGTWKPQWTIFSKNEMYIKIYKLSNNHVKNMIKKLEEFYETINICIVHYNTPYITECLIKSINKYIGYNCNIYIFDNSDKLPFTYKQSNITLFDNTKGQIINFDEWLKKYPNKTLDAKRNGYGSAKHCYSVEKCFDLLNVDEFILMDSDILLKQDIRKIYNCENIFSAEIVKQNNKIIDKAAPFLCYINVKKCKEFGIHYFNENYMFGLHKTDVNKQCDYYDTGAWFYKEAKKYKHETFKLEDYIVHMENASWKTNNNAKEWLLKYKNLYDNENIIISFTTYKNRVKYAPKVIKSLLNQTIKPFKICLTLYKEDLQYVTPELQVFFDNGEVELIISEIDIAPHKKWYNTMKKYKEYPIITVDDDVIYDNKLVETLYKGYLKNNKCISAGRVHKITYNTNGTPKPYNQWQYEYKEKSLEPSYDLCATGIGGILYPPNILQVDDINIEDIMDCLYADDIFLKKRENDLNIKVQWVKGDKILMGTTIQNSEVQNTGLALTNNLKGRNDVYIKSIGLQKKEEQINKTVVYTCITGDYEKLVDPSVISKNFDYICFTDNLSLVSNVWKIKPIPQELQYLSKVKQQRCIKITPHKYLSEYNDSIWVDGNIDIIDDINLFIRDACSNKNKTIFIPQHPSRQCIYKEGAECIKIKKDKSDIINFQMDKYLKEEFPNNYGLVQTGIMYRKHNELSCIEVMEMWKSELLNHSHRDQLSFNYCLWKLKSNALEYLNKNLFDSKYFKWYSRHNRGINNKINNKINILSKTYNINPKTNIIKEKTIKDKEEKKLSRKELVRKISNTRNQFKSVKKKINNETLLKAIYENF